MKIRNSFHFKIFLALWLFGIVLVTVYQLAGHTLFYFTRLAGGADNFELQKEIACVFDTFKTTNRLSYPNSRFFKSYLSTDELPPALRPKLEPLASGYHFIKIYTEPGEERSYQVAIFRQPDNQQRFYIVYDYTLYGDEYLGYQLRQTTRRATLVFVIVVVLGLFMGLFVANRLILPVKRLVAEVRELDPEQLPADFSRNFKNDEIGILAQAFSSSMQRITAYIEREKNFTRDASHELRTPVTVIKGAVEIIQELPEYAQKSLAVPIMRIERAAIDMGDIIDAFLWLAREENITAPRAWCNPGDIVTAVVEENRYLQSDKTVSLEIHIDAQAKVPVAGHVFRILVVNLVRNAFLHTNGGQITIDVQTRFIQITNSTMPISSQELSVLKQPFQKGRDSKGFGIGLAIVERICQRCNFTLDIEVDTESNMRVTLRFEQ